jgi:oxygen-independent coproporphyrinogen-3 oxidase
LKVLINPVEHHYRYDIEHIVKLFFEDPEFLYAEENPQTSGEAAALRLVCRIDEGAESVTAEVAFSEAGGAVGKGRAEGPAQEKKKALNLALLQALTDYTGIEQPWGVLTGVRPVKLYHNHLQKGEDKDVIARNLQKKYGIHPDKIRLMASITGKQLETVPDLYNLEHEVSVYIGIPFCPTKCAYCTFPAYSIKGRNGSVEAFLAGLHWEIEQIGAWLNEHGIGVTSIYFGGGTPTSITAEALDALFATIYRAFPKGTRSRELTVEAGRPDTITPEKIAVMRKWQVDRISINPQSFIQDTLTAIGRHHTIEETLEKYHLARSMGMNNINMDLIIGLPGEGMSEYKYSLGRVARLRPESLTVHTLSFKRASTMTKNKTRFHVADRSEVARMIAYTETWTLDQGYHPYYLYRQKNILGNQENVGYALPGKESIYNIMIMEERQTILGLGCGAASKIISPLNKKITRFANPKEPGIYNAKVKDYTADKVALLNEVYGFSGSVSGLSCK